jgi:hypothetical protein
VHLLDRLQRPMRSIPFRNAMTMYRRLTRSASALIALEVLAFIASATSAQAATAARNLVRPAGVAPYGHLDTYPQNGTPYSQQARDQYECDIAAVKQTGFDPTLEDGGVPPDVVLAKLAEYLRAEAACLEARGYRVKIVHAES